MNKENVSCLVQQDFKAIAWFKGFPGSSAGKESACNAGDLSSISGLGRFPGEGQGNPLQYSWASLVAQTVKNLPAMGRPGLGTSPGGGHGNPLQYSCLENSHGQRSLGGWGGYTP